MTSPVQRPTDVADDTSRSPFDHEISDLTWHEEEDVFGHPEKAEAEEPRRHAVRIIEPEWNSAGSANRADPSTMIKDEPNPQSSKSRFNKWTGRSSKGQQGVEDSKDANDDDAASDFSDYTEQAKRIARTFTKDFNASENNAYSGSQMPSADRAYAYDYDDVPTPKTYKPSIFGALLSSRLQALESDTIQTKRKLYSNNDARASRSSFNGIKESLTGKVIGGHSRSGSTTAPGTETPKKKWFENPEHNALTSMLVHSAIPSRGESGASTPKKMKWYDKPEHSALASMLVHSALPMAGPGLPETKNAMPRRPRVVSRNPSEEKLPMSLMTDLEKGMKRRSAAGSFDTEATLIAELRDIIACKKYLIKLCGAFMKFGAPSHRMEEYLSASARALAIQAEFLYIPGAMICTFIDTTTHNNSVDVVRKNAALDLGRLKDVFNVYKLVIHEKMTAEEGAEEIEKIIKRRDRQGDWFRIVMFGLASLVVGPFSFSTRPIDFGPIFILGCCLGWAQVRLVPKSEHFSNVFEVFACVVIAFISRALGSIKWHGGQEYVFCFSGVAQSSIAMILPGFMVLNSALELQSKNIVSGSVRMVYAIIYVLFLGFGLLIGTTLFGLMKRDAVTEVSCASPEWWTPGLTYRLLYTRFIWAPLFACTVALIYKAKWRQLPVMALIATAGYQANFWISTQLSSNLQVANAIGAFVIGCMANLYSRLFHGLAAAAMLPAIYCQVPGGLAASGSLVAGVNSSSQIFGNSSTISVINNGTAGFVQAQDDPNSVYGGTIFNVGYGMVQVAIGISVGLYLSALVVYPFGKSRSGLFSF